MAQTNFAALTDEEKTVWSRDLWRSARNNMFLSRFLGSGSGAMIQRITELTKSERGTRAVITLVADLEGDGIAGDRQLESNEEQGKAYDQVIQIDQLRNAVRSEGRIADQRSIVNFRETARDRLAYWLADRCDQLAFLTLSGIDFINQTNGAARVGSDFPFLEFNADVTAPSANRHFRWDNTAKALAAADTTAVVATDTPAWELLVQIKAKAKDLYIRALRNEAGDSSKLLGLEIFNVFMTPAGIAKLKQDDNFLKAWREAMPRSTSNPLFKGEDVIFIDGMAIYEYRHVYNTTGLAAGSKWGAASDVDGQRVLICGAQSLAFADIDVPTWIEKDFDYDNQLGISTAKIMGLKKPVFRSAVTRTNEDHGMLVVDTAI